MHEKTECILKSVGTNQVNKFYDRLMVSLWICRYTVSYHATNIVGAMEELAIITCTSCPNDAITRLTYTRPVTPGR